MMRRLLPIAFLLGSTVFFTPGEADARILRVQTKESSSVSPSVRADPRLRGRAVVRQSRRQLLERRAQVRASQSSSARSAPASRSSSPSPAAVDPLFDTEQLPSNFVLFGATTPIAASVQAFINEEPVDVTDIIVTVGGSKQAIDAFLVYDDDRRLLGRATRNGNEFRLGLKTGSFVVPRREPRSLYVRAQLGSYDRNAEGAEAFSVVTVTLEGNGQWSSDDYVKPLTSASFPTFQPSAAVFSTLRSGISQTELLQEGEGVRLFDLHAFKRTADPAAVLAITDLTFRIIATDVTVQNPVLTVAGSGIAAPCAISSSTVSCSSIPAVLGVVHDDYSLELRGDVTVTPGATEPRLQVLLQTPGDPLTAGDIAWTDGASAFTWVPFSSPVVRGPAFSR